MMGGNTTKQTYSIDNHFAEKNYSEHYDKGSGGRNRAFYVWVFLALLAAAGAVTFLLIWLLVPSPNAEPEPGVTSSTSVPLVTSSTSVPLVTSSTSVPLVTSSTSVPLTTTTVNATWRGPPYDYIYRADSHYSWEVTDEVKQENITSYVINMTSLKWFDETWTDRPIWWHRVTVHVPDTVRHPGAGSLYISSRNNRSPADLNWEHTRRMGIIAGEKGLVTAVIEMVPNQPQIIEGTGPGLEEDEIIALTWMRFLNLSWAGQTPPTELLLHMPMAKASVRAMDMMSELMQSKGMAKIDKFFISGQSKRGWTTWLVGAADERVVGMAPTVLSSLNMRENFHHYWRSFGGWPFAFYDYWSHGLMAYLDDFDVLGDITDPYVYRRWMTMPKLLVNGASDEFFLLDDFDYFFDDLPGENHIWILENHGHSIRRGPLADDYWAMLATFTVSILQNIERPTYQYWRNTTSTGGSITVRTSGCPLKVTAWSAPSIDNRREFRLAKLGESGQPELTGIVWTESEVDDLGYGVYRAWFDNPTAGYFAFYMKITYSALDNDVFTVTTKAHIIPEGFPFEDCAGQGCQGTLV